MTQLDYGVLIGYFIFSAAFGLWFVHRYTGKMNTLGDFFLSGRGMPWWLLGTSMVATTFAADSPILAARMAAEFGLYFSWMIMPTVLTATLTTFFFARMWRRSEVLTDVEFLEMRYPGKPGRFLRGFKALYLGGLINALIIGTQLIAIGEIGEHVLGVEKNTAMFAGAAVALLYSVVAGFAGVVISDFLQFIIAVAGSILLAVFALRMPEVGGLGGLVEQLSDGVTRGTGEGAVNVPVLKMAPGVDTPYMTIYILLIPLCVSWWSVVSGGMEPGGGGQVAQRMLAARSERHAVGASLWFNVAHFAVRVWPWLLVGLACVVIYPDSTNFQGMYASAIRDTLPSGVRGLVVASFFAAFITTMDTRLNLGSAYLVSDFYRRFWVRDRDEAHYVRAGRAATVILSVVPFAIPFLFRQDILGVLMFWLQITAGTGLVYILRWYWWRVNAWSEISAMVSAIVYTVLLLWLRHDWDMGAYTDSPDGALVDILIVTLLTTATWIPATLLSTGTDRSGLYEFYRRIRPAGPGWRRIAEDLESEGLGGSPDDMRSSSVAWISASIFLLSVFFGTGKLLLMEPAWGIGLLALAFASLLVLLREIRHIFK